ncbi:unnamed protein product, partial [Iphiclides podalirius]
MCALPSDSTIVTPNTLAVSENAYVRHPRQRETITLLQRALRALIKAAPRFARETRSDTRPPLSRAVNISGSHIRAAAATRTLLVDYRKRPSSFRCFLTHTPDACVHIVRR